MKTCLLLLIITFGVLCVPVEGCMRGGIPPAGAAGIIALCVIFSPVLLVVGTGMAAREGVRKIKRHGERRRVTSNVIRKQRNRMIKKVGAKNFDNYLQDLYDRAKTEASPDLYTELGTAFFLNNDLIHANDWLTKALEFPNITTGVFKKRGAAYFMRGMVNQYLYDFVQAVEDFREAQKYLDSNRTTTGEGGAELPQLTVQDAVNAAGFAKMMQAIYVASDDEERIRGLLSDAITDMTTAIDTTKELQGMYFHNRGFARYHRTYYLPADQTTAELELSVADFNTAIGSGNFGTTAEGHSMKSQCLARLGRIEEGLKEQETAIQLDDKVFTVELTDEVALKVPWPLPADKYKNNSANHRFQETSFKMPHYCSHCSQLIKKGKGFECYACNFRCHTHCQPKVADKDCWELMKMEKYSVTLSEQSYGNVATDEQLQMNHIHHLSAVHFNKPTWCGLCSKLVASPFGKQGYRCTDCGVKIHKDCLGIAGSHIIEN